MSLVKKNEISLYQNFFIQRFLGSEFKEKTKSPYIFSINLDSGDPLLEIYNQDYYNKLCWLLWVESRQKYKLVHLFLI